MGYEIVRDGKPLAPTQKRYGRNYLVRKTFAILRSFREMDEGLTSRDLAQRAQIPNSSGHRIVSTLEEIGALSRGPRGRYQPGFLLASLALSVDISHALRQLSREIVCSLSFRLGRGARVAVLQDGIVHTVLETSAQGMLISEASDAGLDPFSSAAGRVLLADLPAGRLERLLSAGRQIPAHLPDAETVRRDLAQVKANGFALDRQGGIAVPISDRNGRLVAALFVQGRADDIEPRVHGELVQHLMAAAAAIRRRTGSGPAEDQTL
ncbi:MAG TPA: helix-turn-helix domain-containing protein [Rhizomicrobium sp.]|nr:helix-turn-helix domain-containing protein [Rhizomicrobium sp.]